MEFLKTHLEPIKTTEILLSPFYLPYMTHRIYLHHTKKQFIYLDRLSKLIIQDERDIYPN